MENSRSFDDDRIHKLVAEIHTIAKDHRVALIPGGGNIARGGELIGKIRGLKEVTAHQIGMKATELNAMVLQDVLCSEGVKAEIINAFDVRSSEIPRLTRKYWDESKVVIFSGGTGNPFCTTDEAMVVRGLELGLKRVFKGTKVDGIYDKDPRKYADAKYLPVVTHSQFLEARLGIMDEPAIAKARSRNLEIRVFNIFTPGHLRKTVISHTKKEEEHIYLYSKVISSL